MKVLEIETSDAFLTRTEMEESNIMLCLEGDGIESEKGGKQLPE